MDLKTKAQSINKLGQPITAYVYLVGVCLKQIDDETFRLSLSDGEGRNWVDDVLIGDIELGGQFRRKVSSNEYIEIEDESCGSGGCKI